MAKEGKHGEAKTELDPAAVKAAEDAELDKMMKDEQAKLEAEAKAGAEALAKAAAEKPQPAAAAPPARIVGDIPVVCAKDGSGRCGGRHYQFKKGDEILMDPGHAEELSEGGWITPVRVHGA